MRGKHFDISNDPEAPELVVVREGLREELMALGCSEVGYVGTVIVGSNWSLVAQAFACPDRDSVVALYSTEMGGDGVAFWTLFDNGTVLTTEGDTRTQHFRILRLLVGNNPRDNVITRLVRLGSVKDLYARHRENIRSVLKRETTRAREDDPFLTYLAVRISASARLDKAGRDMQRMMERVRFPAVVLPIAILAGLGAIRRGLVVGLLFAALCAIPIALVMARVAWWFTVIVTRRTHPPPPKVSADDLLAKARSVPSRRWKSVLASY
jgi:hypothetical protein